MDVLLKAVGFLSACKPLTEEVKVADALDNSLSGKSFPRAFAEFELATAFLLLPLGRISQRKGPGTQRLGSMVWQGMRVSQEMGIRWLLIYIIKKLSVPPAASSFLLTLLVFSDFLLPCFKLG